MNDPRVYFAEDLGTSSGQAGEDVTSKLEEAVARRTLVLESLQIFAFDGKDAAQYQGWLEARLALQMRRCDICIREFYRGRKVLKERLNK